MNKMPDSKTRARRFLSVASQFRLGSLPTEQPHQLTKELSSLAVHDPVKALILMHRIDSEALAVVWKTRDAIVRLAKKIDATLLAGKSVFLCGCGATGRLSIALETLWRMSHTGHELENRVVGFMAGGDVALVRSIENMEDHPEYGKRQLGELGFRDGDLLISCTEGGETPFVIGATEHAAARSSNAPFFLYCNPDEALRTIAERSARIILDSRISKINLSCGPMALAGSTRMQASTVLMAAAGLALLWHAQPDTIPPAITALIHYWKKLDTSFLKQFVVLEASCYGNGDYCLYETGKELAITVLTDTTERSPTFSMHPFENTRDAGALRSLCYLFLPEAMDSKSAWNMLLYRAPRPLSWKKIGPVASSRRLFGFDFSPAYIQQRIQAALPAMHRQFIIKHDPQTITLTLDSYSAAVPAQGLSMLAKHLVLKMLLNTHSTLVMGRLGRYDGNVMTWVKASNNKLIDRTIRYVDILLQRQGITVSYERIAYACFELMETTPNDQSLVHAAARYLSGVRHKNDQ